MMLISIACEIMKYDQVEANYLLVNSVWFEQEREEFDYF